MPLTRWFMRANHSGVPNSTGPEPGAAGSAESGVSSGSRCTVGCESAAAGGGVRSWPGRTTAAPGRYDSRLCRLPANSTLRETISWDALPVEIGTSLNAPTPSTPC
jgi:hypothetical protein